MVINLLYFLCEHTNWECVGVHRDLTLISGKNKEPIKACIHHPGPDPGLDAHLVVQLDVGPRGGGAKVEHQRGLDREALLHVGRTLDAEGRHCPGDGHLGHTGGDKPF